MGISYSSHPRSQSLSAQYSHRSPSFLDPGCLGCFQNPDKMDFNVDNAELQTHNRDLIPKGKISQASIAYLQKEEIGFLKACAGKNVSALRYYMNRGANVNLLDEDRTSPLHVASRSGSLQVVEELINWGSAVNIADMAGWTSLHIAAHYQRSLVCHLLLKKGADPYLINRNGETPWDLVKDKNTEEVFYVHFDRTDLKKMGKQRKDEPPGEVNDENILINQLKMKDTAFQNRLGIELRTGGSITEEEKNDDKVPLSKRVMEDLPSGSRMLSSNRYGSIALQSTKRSTRQNLGTTQRDRRPENSQRQHVKKLSVDKKENDPRNRKLRDIVSRKESTGEEHLYEGTNAPKKHKYYSHFRKMKALQNANFHQNKEVLCTLESDESGFPDHSYFSNNNSSMVNDYSFQNRLGFSAIGSRNLEDVPEDQDMSHAKNIKSASILPEPALPRRRGSGHNSNAPPKPRTDFLVAPTRNTSLAVDKPGLPPYLYPKQFAGQQGYYQAYHQQQANPFKRHSRDNSVLSSHTRRSSVSGIEKTNMSGISFTMTPALSIYKLFSKESKESDLHFIHKNNPTNPTEGDNLVDLTPFKMEPKYTKTLYNIAVQMFNYDCIKGLAFMFLFKLLRQSPREIALFLQKGDAPETIKKSPYQITQLLCNSHLKEALDILYHYVGFLQFEGMTFLEALRAYLNNFVLENDPEKIDWLLRGFTKRYYSTIKRLDQPIRATRENENRKRETFDTPEAVHMLAFATVMLDLELNHTSNVENRKRDTVIKGEFCLSLAYVNGGENFSKSFTDEIFDAVKKRKIIKLIGQEGILQADKSFKFRLETIKLTVKAKKNSKRERKEAKDYLLYFEGPLCCIVKVIGDINELKGVFVAKGCKAERLKAKKMRFKKVGTDQKEGIPFAKFKPAGDLAVSTRQDVSFLIENVEEAIKVQKYLESIPA